MRKREALRRARAFVTQSYPAYAGSRVEVALEHDGERQKSWSFGVHADTEEPEEDYPVGYVHADGAIEGLY